MLVSQSIEYRGKPPAELYCCRVDKKDILRCLNCVYLQRWLLTLTTSKGSAFTTAAIRLTTYAPYTLHGLF